jgi:Cytochrome c554 and c-prime
MAQALKPAPECDILKRHTDLTFQEGAYKSRITRDGERTLLTVTDGRETIAVPLLWAFGQGQAGQTYVFERNGAFYESRVSFYNALGSLDLTMGAGGSQPKGLDDAAGRRMDAGGARDCFACHSTGAVSESRLHLERMAPGVGCESCHGPGEKHVAAVRAGNPPAAKMPKLSSLGAEEMAELCGGCHRTWSQIAMNGPRGVLNVRFQPYRLANSKCYDATDSRIRCSACHDAHSPLETKIASYDTACSACHSATASHTKDGRQDRRRYQTCSVAKENCITCHMPKIELPGAHARFTDHQIRIVRANQPYPN